MADSIKLSQDAVDLIRTHAIDGSGMIATCRAIFSGNYKDEIYNSDLLDVFQLISDESDHIVLDNFGNFNSIYRSPAQLPAASCKDEIDKIQKFYLVQFERAVRNFREKFEI
jgi:hypothetical protein